MKVYISADIEGVTGLVSWSQCGRPNSDHYDFRYARERMTADVNAAIRGARKAGATEVVVKDSHGNSKNLLASDLEPGTHLISGHGVSTEGMMANIDNTYACALLVGYHAMAGTLHGVMEHTITGQVHRLKINGHEAGEIAMAAGVAGRHGVPVVMVSSDLAGCNEASALLPGVEVAVTKKGIGRHMAHCFSPEETSAAIEEAAERAVRRAPNFAVQPYLPEPPYTFTIEFNRQEEADNAARLARCHRLDAYTVEYYADNWDTAHQAAWNLLMLGLQGRDSDR